MRADRFQKYTTPEHLRYEKDYHFKQLSVNKLIKDQSSPIALQVSFGCEVISETEKTLRVHNAYATIEVVVTRRITGTERQTAERRITGRRWNARGGGGRGLLSKPERHGGGRPAPSPAEPRSAPGAGRAPTSRT